ncbi:MAG: 3-phosphoglycerate dehydrogenase [Clostridiales bacterium]|jgi:D-3-phosphoglycerate dehydrogenase|nr:3-phosphoglycerate dehydrogenase [Clostridiales bacterium]
MYTVKTLNKIAPIGTERFNKAVIAVNEAANNPDAIMVRSADMLNYDFNQNLLCIARAGAGYNNIPVQRCAQDGIVVFNTPGANAGGVKELVLCALFLSSRNIFAGCEWVKTIADKQDDVPALVEKGKSTYAGPEILGKTLGLIGLGAIGAKVARDASALGMTVYGIDPFLPDDVKADLSPTVRFVDDIDELYANADYISLHLPYNSETKNKICAESIAKMKDGVRIINIARGELVCDDDMLAALETGKVSCYVTDFPNAKTACAKGVVAIPHLGASTPESEDNCAIMAADQISEYLLNGNLINAVNLPNITMARSGKQRAVVIAKAGPDTPGALLKAAEEAGVSVVSSASKTKGDYSVSLLDFDRESAAVEDALKAVEGVIRVRVI